MQFFFFNDTATTEIYTLSLHDALPIYLVAFLEGLEPVPGYARVVHEDVLAPIIRAYEAVALLVAEPLDRSDRKSTRLNSSHANISYAVFCLKKKNRT